MICKQCNFENIYLDICPKCKIKKHTNLEPAYTTLSKHFFNFEKPTEHEAKQTQEKHESHCKQNEIFCNRKTEKRTRNSNDVSEIRRQFSRAKYKRSY